MVRVNANIRTMRNFYIGVVQSVLLYASETWTMTGEMVDVMEKFHRRNARQICGRTIKPKLKPKDQQNTQMETGEEEGTEWVYPNTEDVLETMDLDPIVT